MSTRLEKLEARAEGKGQTAREQRAARSAGVVLRPGHKSALAKQAAFWPIPPARSPAARRIAEWFGLPVREKHSRTGRRALWREVILPQPGQIMLITGPSGSGKSCLMRALARRAGASVINVNRIRPRSVPCVDQFGDDVALALDLMSRVGLGEALTYMQLPRELSDGQRWRLRLALGVAAAMKTVNALLMADEFCAVLDRVSAAVVARALRRTIDRLSESGLRLGAVVATSHDDLEEALRPDLAVRCDFGSTQVLRERRFRSPERSAAGESAPPPPPPR